mgnify:CR=1 FL=1
MRVFGKMASHQGGFLVGSSKGEWETMGRACLIVGLVVASVIFSALLFVGFVFFAFFVPQDFPEDPEPGIVLSEIPLEKTAAVDDPRIGLVSEIRWFPAATESEQVGIVSGEGILRASAHLEPGPFQRLSRRRKIVRFAGADAAGFTHLIGVTGWQGASIYDADGVDLWNPPARIGVNSVAAADFLGNGSLQFAVGYNGGGGIRLHDQEGTELWSESDGNVWHVEPIQRPGEDTWLILHSNAGGFMRFRGADGKIITENRPSAYFSSFSLSPWPDSNGDPHIVYLADDTVWVYDASGNRIALLDAPIANRLGDAYATPVRLQPDADSHFAVVVSLFTRSVLFLYDTNNRLVYHEVLEDYTTAIAAIPEPGTDTESLLVGGEGKVWRYRWDETKSNQAETDSSS